MVSILANAGGIGGGALLTPIYIWLFDFSVEDAIPLSKMTIFMGAIVNYLILKNARLEDNSNLPLINYSLAGVIVPMLLAGTSIGVFGAKFFPPILILGFLSGFLVLSTFKMFQKALKMWKKETMENGIDSLDHSYSQNKMPFHEHDKNVYSESSTGKIFGENAKMKNNFNCQKIMNGKPKYFKFDNKKIKSKKEEEENLIPKLNSIKFSNPESIRPSEDSQIPHSQSLHSNPFWNSRSGSQNNSLKGLNQKKSKNFISNFKLNPGKLRSQSSNQ
jgi:hypothetical protein